jgi:hypothetical protein
MQGKHGATMMSLTETDRKVLTWMVNIRIVTPVLGSYQGYATPAEIGVAMGGTVSGKPQGLGRMGGRRAKRLREMGLVENCSFMRRGFLPAYRVTALGVNVERNLRLENNDEVK